MYIELAVVPHRQPIAEEPGHDVEHLKIGFQEFGHLLSQAPCYVAHLAKRQCSISHCYVHDALDKPIPRADVLLLPRVPLSLDRTRSSPDVAG
jgi:hypothetical protein